MAAEICRLTPAKSCSHNYWLRHSFANANLQTCAAKKTQLPHPAAVLGCITAALWPQPECTVYSYPNILRMQLFKGLEDNVVKTYYGNCTLIQVQFPPKYWCTCFSPHSLCVLVSFSTLLCHVLQRGCGLVERGHGLTCAVMYQKKCQHFGAIIGAI